MNGSTSEIDTGSGQSWKSVERLAMDDRGEALRIFDISQEKAPPSPKSLSSWQMIIKTQLTIDASNVVDWVADGIKAQNDQFVNRFLIHTVS